MPKEHSTLEVINFWATYILASVAIAGFIFTMISNDNVSETLDTIRTTFEDYTEPIFDLKEYQWFKLSENLDCEHLPIGIYLVYVNSCNFPIRFTEDSVRLVYKNITFQMPSGESSIIIDKKESLIPPNNKFPITLIYPASVFASIFEDKGNIYKQPWLEVHLYGILSNLSQTKNYRIHLIHYILNDCASLNTMNFIDVSKPYIRI